MAEEHASPSHERPARMREVLGEAQGDGIRIALIDSGVDAAWEHPQIRPGISLADPDGGFALVRSQDTQDRIGHGTACCDILLGIAPQAEILPVRVFGSRLETSPEVIVAALDWAIEERVSLINMSLGSLLDTALVPFYRACERAREAGVVVVSAVHLGESWSFPAVFDNALGVTAGRFSNVYDYEYLPGQGTEFRAQGDREVRGLGRTIQAFGSSFAAPHITAVAALFLEKFPGADLDRIRDLLARHAIRTAESPPEEDLPVSNS